MKEPHKKELDLQGIVRILLKKWYWFLISVLFFVSIAYVYNRYATPKYKVNSKIQVLEEKGASPELAVFKELDLLSGSQNAIEDEIEVLGSRSNFVQVVRNLDLNLILYEIGDVKKREIYIERPLTVNFLASDSIVDESSLSFYIRLDSPNSFGFKINEDVDFIKKDYGKNIKTKIGDVLITPNQPFAKRYLGNVVKVQLIPVSSVAQGYKKAVKIGTIEKYSKIINLSLEDAVPQKAKAVLDELVRVYNQNAIDDKKQIADKTYTFINERISEIASSLSSVDQTAQEFMTSRGITDISSQADVNINLGAATQQELQNAQTQLNIANSMQGMVESQEEFDVLPANVGLSDPTLANTTARYNQLVQERKRLLKSSNEKNPMIVNIDEQLSGLRRSLLSSLNNMTNSLELSVNNLSSRQSSINSRIYSAPTNQRALRDITRKQETTESLYLYLLQRREESQVTLASTSPKSKIIDYAYMESDDPVSPNKLKIYMASMILGFLIPFGVIYFQHNFDNKIHNKSQLEKTVTEYPILAELPKLGSKESKLVENDDRSALGESLRILRTNLDYLIKSKTGPHNNLVLITSSVSGEGKTFLSTNLAKILASTGKRVLLIGADIRNPKMYQYFKGISGNNEEARKGYKYGLSEYLHNDTLTIKDVINQIVAKDDTMDVIYSGKILPNPSELLMRDRMNDLLQKVSDMYDYVLIDSAPLMLVTDSLLISSFVNHTIYVTRAGVSELEVVKFPIGLHKEGKIKGLSFVVNDVKNGNLGYVGRYGYGYGAHKKKWYQL